MVDKGAVTKMGGIIETRVATLERQTYNLHERMLRLEAQAAAPADPAPAATADAPAPPARAATQPDPRPAWKPWEPVAAPATHAAHASDASASDVSPNAA